uniref:uncharacterized protein tp53i13 isoform X2 n=1 Tax=Scatophagus argus TaxID=75038 RepID=UPI001ED854F2|nr:uncharacterized protein tp53i13 isoform X2 [Scatophagus argus]
MPSQTTSPPLTVTVLAALWVSLGRCDVSESLGPGCDSGKLYLDKDLSEDVVYWDCPVSIWSESAQRLTSIDTVYDPEPARQICMDKSISYHHTIPNSGAFRPVRAESGEYLYCPPQRWLNNLHHAATVLLYHPCIPLHERLHLSVLARSCLSDYIITAHPQLNKHRPIALVSWGRTLELSTTASSDICDWLEATASTSSRFDGVSQSRKYNLLLIWSAEQRWQQHAHPEENSAKMKESLRLCCEKTISSLLNRPMVAKEGKIRRIRAAIRENPEKRENTRARVSSFTSNQTLSITGDVQDHNNTLGPTADSSPGNRTPTDPPATRGAPSPSKIQNLNQDLTPRSTSLLGSIMPETTLRTQSLGSGATGYHKSRLTQQTAAQQLSPQHTALRNPSAGLDALGVNSEHNHIVRSDGLALGSKDEGKDSVSHLKHVKESDSREKHSTANGMMKDNEVVDVKERELEHKQPQQHLNPQPASYLPNSHNCDGCKAGERCECNKDLEAEAQVTVVNKGLPRTPRTDEAVWAAASLGFLLVLLTLSVLHTRLYRHWRTTPSLYWHDPQQDYDSVADVIRRRLRIAKRRRKRGRRQECVLLPSSSSSDDNP